MSPAEAQSRGKGHPHSTALPSLLSHLLKDHELILSSCALVDLTFIPACGDRKEKQKPHSELLFLAYLLMVFTHLFGNSQLIGCISPCSYRYPFNLHLLSNYHV